MSLRENVEAGLWQSELAAASHREALGKWTLLSGLHHPASPTMDVDPHTAPSGLDLVLIVCIGTPTSSTYNHSVTVRAEHNSRRDYRDFNLHRYLSERDKCFLIHLQS